MSSAAWIAAAVAVGVGGVYLLAQGRKEDEDDKGPLPCGAVKGVPYAGKACELANDLLAALGVENCDQRQAKNVELNGALEHASPAMPRAVTPGSGTLARPIMGCTGLRHANGCEPWPGAPGQDKCVPGTTIGAVQSSRATPLSGVPWSSSKVSGDPTTFTDKELRGRSYLPAKPFPLSVPAGHTAVWSRGKPYVCAPGTGLGGPVRDHRTGASPCQPLGEDGTLTGILPPRGDGTEPLCDAQGRAPDGKPRRCTTDHRTSPPTSRCNCRLPAGGSINVTSKV